MGVKLTIGPSQGPLAELFETLLAPHLQTHFVMTEDGTATKYSLALSDALVLFMVHQWHDIKVEAKQALQGTQHLLQSMRSSAQRRATVLKWQEQQVNAWQEKQQKRKPAAARQQPQQQQLKC
jgi:hypothetical protein